ncbi:AGE family epimerase/isomerase [Izhakiella australiensis]|nr:AGE family epimerase/isomerase [Izhakiella australiensis]
MMLTSARQFVDWMQQTALPRFLHQGVISLADGTRCFAESLPNVTPVIRSRVQNRQLYVYAHATRSGWLDAGNTLSKVLEHGLAPFRDAAGIFYFSNADDENARQQNAYEQAFALLALSELFALTGESRFLQRAHRIHDWMQQHLALAEGGYALNARRPPLLSQNPNMHLFEAMIGWWQLTGDKRWEQEAHRLFTLFHQHLFDTQRQCLMEFFAAGWRPDLPQSQHLDPGHHHEWTWLLYQYQTIAGVDTRPWRSALQRFAISYGENKTSGAVMNEINADGTAYRAECRLWCQTERLKADVVACLETEDSAAPERLEHHCEQLMAHYVTGETGRPYCDEINAHGQRSAQPAPASTLYHLYVAARQVERLLPSSDAK